MIVELTGGVGSGKSRILEFLKEEYGAEILQTDETARRRLDEMVPQLAKEAGATEALKAADPMSWVGLMNNCKAQAEEIILSELVFS